jgi:hypothetical protein
MNFVFNFNECCCKRESFLKVEFGLPKLKKGVIIMSDTTITTEQKIIGNVLTPKTAAGNPAPVDGKPTWTKLSPAEPDGCNLVIAEDGLSADVVSGDNIGDSVFQVDADADLGEGVETISVQFTVHVVSPKASSLGFGFGTVVQK